METLCRQAEQASQTVLQDEVHAAPSQQTSSRNLTDSVINLVLLSGCVFLPVCVSR